MAASGPPAISFWFGVCSSTRYPQRWCPPVVSCGSGGGGGADGSPDLSPVVAAVLSLPSLLVVCCFGSSGSQPGALWSLPWLFFSLLSAVPLAATALVDYWFCSPLLDSWFCFLGF